MSKDSVKINTLWNSKRNEIHICISRNFHTLFFKYSWSLMSCARTTMKCAIYLKIIYDLYILILALLSVVNNDNLYKLPHLECSLIITQILNLYIMSIRQTCHRNFWNIKYCKNVFNSLSRNDLKSLKFYHYLKKYIVEKYIV